MKIRVKLHSILRDYLPREAKGKATLELAEGATLRDLLGHLHIERQCIILVNGEELTDKEHPLRPNDEVQMLMALGGGI